MTNFRQKAEECYARYKETSDPAEAAASDAYNEAANEIERLAARVESLETVADLNLQTGERLAAENDQLKNALRAAQIGLTKAEATLRNTLLHYDISDVHFLDSAPTRPDDKNRDG